MKDELSLRELFDILRKRARVLIVVPVLMAVLALSYTYWIARSIYASTATINISPLQVQSQLEQKILVQNVHPLDFESLKAIAFSEKVLGSVLASLQKVRNLPKQWQDRGSHSAIEYFVKDIKLKGSFSSQAPLAQGQLPSLVASFSVNAPTPDIAAKTANLWAGATARQVNYLPLDQLKISLALFEKTVTPAEQTYRAAQYRWERFNRSSTLVQDKAELDARIQERVSLDTERASLERNLAAVQGRIQVLESSANQQGSVVSSDASPDQLVLINQRFEAAKAHLASQTAKSQQTLKQVAQSLQTFRQGERISVWQIELNHLSQRLAEVLVRQSAISTDIVVKASRVRALEPALAQEPQLLDVVREVVADPVVALAVAKGDVQALAGLKLKVQEINPAYQALLVQMVSLRTDLAALEAEGRGLGAEQNDLTSKIEGLKTEIAVQQRAKEAITLAYGTQKAAYEALKTRYDQIANLDANQLVFDSSNPEYQRLRSAKIDAQVEQAQLLARRNVLEARTARVEADIRSLQERVSAAQVEADQVNQALDLAKSTYLALSQKRTDLQIEIANSQNALAQVIAPAYPIYEKVAPKRGLITAAAVVLGLLLAVLWAFLTEAIVPQV